MTARSLRPRRVMMLGATGTIGRATTRALVERGHDVVCLIRPRPGRDAIAAPAGCGSHLAGATLRFGDVTDAGSLARDGFRGERFDALVSCLASRTGAPRDAWAIDYAAHRQALAAAKNAGVSQMVLLSAICVQKPRLTFQQAKLAFERDLIASGVVYSIVRPTAFFKSLSGQVERVRKGKPFLLFGDGALTSCKPIGDDDLGVFLADCLDDADRRNRILPVGGPGAAITPRQQGDMLFALVGRTPRFRHIPVAMISAIAGTLAMLGRCSGRMAEKAELARIARYYATESMLVLDPATGLYDAAATPSFGAQTLHGFYEQLLAGTVSVDRRDHAVF